VAQKILFPLRYVVGKSCNRGFKRILTKMVLLRKICVHISLLWENLMTTAVLKNHQLIIQTVHAPHVYKSEDKDKRAGIIHHIHWWYVCLHFLIQPKPYGPLPFSQNLFFFSVIYFHIMFLQAAGVAQSVQRLLWDGSFGVETPVAARFCAHPPSLLGTVAKQVCCPKDIGAFYQDKAAREWHWPSTPILCRG
jgi:hypothetical protein